MLLSEDRDSFRLSPIKALTPNDTDLFTFAGSVGPTGENRRDDVIKAQILLANSGHYRLAGQGVPTGWPGHELFRGIRSFQKEKGLEVDGVLLPPKSGGADARGIGETLVALRGDLGRKLTGFAAPSPQEVDAHYRNAARFSGAPEGSTEPPQPSSILTYDEAGRKAALPVGAKRMPATRESVQLAQAGTPKPDLTVGGTAPPLTTTEPIMAPVPAHKKDIFARPENRDAWESHQQALRKLLPDKPVLRGVLAHLYSEEGGRIPDPASGAVGGILPGTLEDLRRRGKLPGLPEHLKTGNLTPEQQVHVQQVYFEDVLHTVGGAKALEALPQGMADAIADTLYLDGRGDGTKFLQRAINTATGERQISVDGRMGPQTIQAIRDLSKDPALRDAWLDAIADVRLSGKKRSQGEIDRISRLRSDGRR